MNYQSDRSENTRDAVPAFPVNREELAHGLTDLKDTLDRISAQTEPQFIELGRLLQKAHEEGRVIEQKAEGIVELAQGDQGKHRLQAIRQLIAQSRQTLESRRETIARRSQSVRKVVSHLAELETKNEDIERLAKYLRAVALNIFIETSRSQALSENFSIIATEIKQLSETILTLSRTIRETVAESGQRFVSIHSGIESGMDQMARLTVDADRSVGHAMEQTDAWIDLVGHTASSCVDHHKVVRDEVGKIVMSLQFHDAMRQRLEHIGTGLDDMALMCRTPDTGQPDQDRENRAMIHALCGLLSDQLAHIIVELGDVYDLCMTSFDTVNQRMAQVEQSVAHLAGDESPSSSSGRKASAAGTRLVDTLSEFMSVQTRGADLVVQMDEAYQMVSRTASSLSGQIGEIHQISMDAHIKALNAIIAATHLGHEGKTLSVLAGEMKSLSDLVDRFVRDVEAILSDLIAHATLDPSDGASHDEDDGQLLNENVQALPRLVDRMKQESNEIKDNGIQVHQVHDAALSHLDFMPAMVDEIVRQKDRLDHIRDNLAAFRDLGVDVRKIHDLLEQRYTMEKERMVHRKSLSEDEVEHTEAPPDDLGDNFELF